MVFEWDAPSSGVEPFTYHIHLDGVAVDSAGETRLESPYFVECTSDRQQSMEFFVTATSHGFESPPSNSITLCFA